MGDRWTRQLGDWLQDTPTWLVVCTVLAGLTLFSSLLTLALRLLMAYPGGVGSG